MAQARYILRLSDGSLFPWYEPWLKGEGFVEYDPKVHGIRSEVAAQMGLVAPVVTLAPAPAPVVAAPQPVVAPEPEAGLSTPATPVAAEPVAKAQVQPSEPDLSDVFAQK